MMVFVLPGHSDMGCGPAVLEMAEHSLPMARGKRQQPLSMELQQQRGQAPEGWVEKTVTSTGNTNEGHFLES